MPFIDSDKPVFAIEYPRGDDDGSITGQIVRDVCFSPDRLTSFQTLVKHKDLGIPYSACPVTSEPDDTAVGQGRRPGAESGAAASTEGRGNLLTNHSFLVWTDALLARASCAPT